MKKYLLLSLQCFMIFAVTACSGGVAGAVEEALVVQSAQGLTAGSDTTSTIEAASVSTTPVSVEYKTDDLQPASADAEMALIKLVGDSITFEGSGATVEDSVITITDGGVYAIRGSLDDGQIRVDIPDDGVVTLVLQGVDITSATSAPIYMLNAGKTIITLADGTGNSLTDGNEYILEDETAGEPNAAIFSKDDLTINGSGTLTVNASYLNGILSKDDLKITGGTISVNAANDGLRGRNSIGILDGTIKVNAGGDGLQSNNDEGTDKGYISIDGGTLDITAGLDGIQAETNLLVSGGTINITSRGGSINSSSTSETWGAWGEGNTASDSSGDISAKGLKAGVGITIDAGDITIDSSDDALNSNDSLTINGGTLHLASGDDGMHANTSLVVGGGNITIEKSYEGIESASLTINGGTIHITSSDDGMNTSGGVDGSSINGRPGQNEFAMGGDYPLFITGGYIYIDALSDGIDINGPIEMSAGTVIVSGPINDGNGALDYMGSFNITGGYLLAVGSSGMAMAPSESSSQYSIMYNYSSMLSAGTLIHLETEGGETLLTFSPARQYASVVLSSPELSAGSSLVLYSSGSSTGTSLDGLYSGGTYTPGSQVAAIQISGVVTTSGVQGAGMPGGFPGGGGRPARP